MLSFGARCIACALTLAAIFGPLSSPARARASAPAALLVQVTTSGYENSPVYSPDSRHIAFISYRDNELGDIFIMNADGSGQTRLTNASHGSIRDAPLAWSPDGRHILFTAEEPAGSFSDVYSIVANGSGDAVNLTNTPGVFDLDAQWSPDGNRIVFTSGGRIRLMNADGTGAIPLTNDARYDDESPAWSPTGREIAFARLDGLEQDGHICVINVDGTALTQLTDDPAFVDQSPLWAPGGTAISFTRGELGGIASVFVMDRDGSNPLNVTGDIPVAGPGVWSPNGGRIAFASGNRFDAAGDIYVVNPDGSSLTNLTDSPSMLDSGPPSWSRNGLRLIFSSATEGWPHGDIFSVAASPHATNSRR